ncbi:DUF2231 domain-containing protein [Microlunatus sp. Gsoil 973]|jgi:uncharacterized membrane protein|uniref:DUF2231 domain-containing protein n=1 Tax=Microlunatus sp. Gsoil 973 TaxID=2672569 RepID=UPI0012B47969|nr:DUF2231 domain-containing protein [Microlunatus sp. Gsoil 973]QGN35197.1 DUF2231 domain-containing protein [Microlunatus sp. Gsoil 973]
MARSTRGRGLIAKDPIHVRLMKRVETTPALNPGVGLLRRVAEPLTGSPARTRALQGNWTGHAIHPPLTDVPIGAWVSASLLDLLGGRSARPAATRLIGLGILATVPTVLTGLAEWRSIDPESQRVGVLHASVNSVALSLYTASWFARHRDRHGNGVLLALAGGSVAGLGAYLGGHLTEVRKISTRHPGFDR